MIDYAKPFDFDIIYKIYGKNTDLLGPPFPAAIREALLKNEVLKVIDNNVLVGFCNFHKLKDDSQVTVYEICVDESARGKGYGKEMVQYLYDKFKIPIVAKCVKDSTAEAFWKKVGILKRYEKGKKRELAVYQVGLHKNIKRSLI